MSTITKVFLCILAAVVLFIGYNKFKPRPSDYEYLMSLPGVISGLAEKRLGAEIRRFISDDYKDKKGRSYQDLNGIITMHILQKGEISIYPLETTVDLKPTMQPPVATLTFKAAMLRGQKQPGPLDVVPAAASVYSFKFNLEKTSEGWLIKSGDWEPVSGQ